MGYCNLDALNNINDYSMIDRAILLSQDDLLKKYFKDIFNNYVLLFFWKNNWGIKMDL